MASAAACGGKDDDDGSAPLKAPSLLELDLTEAFGERQDSILIGHRPDLASAVSRVTKLGHDALARGLFVRLGALEGQWSDVEEWASVFDALRAAKRPVHCAFDSLDNAGYALAAHCDTLSMTPSGSLDLVGMAVQVLHGRELLQALGVQADLVQVGRYKGAADPFTRDSMSEPLRQSLDGLLTDLDERFRTHLRTRTALDQGELQRLLDGGPYHADAAQTEHLVDRVAFDDEARSRAKAAVAATATRPVFPHAEGERLSLQTVLDALSADDEAELKEQDRLVLATLVGEIVDGERMGPSRMAGDPFVSAMRRFGDDPHVKAVVLRVESPGGSALASNLMWHAVRRVAARKPVVVSMGDMAASGGYYVASAGTHVLATPGSIVGSIGVVGGKVVFGGLAERVGVHGDTLTRAQHAAWLSPLAPFDDVERGRLEGLLRDTYDRFLQRVALGRKRDVAQIAAAAEGRVMGGARAMQLGLVDELGGVARALEVARQRSKLPHDAPVEPWPGPSDPLAVLGSALGGTRAPTLEADAIAELVRLSPVQASALWVTHLTPGRPAAVLPAHLSVR